MLVALTAVVGVIPHARGPLHPAPASRAPPSRAAVATHPALVLVLGPGMTEAVGTSMLVIVINSVVAPSARVGHSGIDLAVVAPFAVSSIAGVLAGSWFAGRHRPASRQRWFAGLLVAVALYTLTRSLLALG